MANSRVRSRELKECYILEPDNIKLNGHCVFEIALREANRASDNRDTCAYVVSLLTLINPDFEDVLMNRSTELGIRVIHTVKLPSQAEEYMIDYHVDRSQILVLFVITILLLFKNVSRVKYVNFMTKRINAMCAILGCLGRELEIPYSFTKAEAIRSMLGASMPLKEAVINFVISATRGSTNQLSSLCGYLFGFLAWSKMYAYKVMYETLVLTGSPVIIDPSVRVEALNLCETYRAVKASEYPQFFRYTGGGTAQKKLEKSRFPLLFAVAQNLTPYRQSSNYVTTSNFSEQDNQLVRELIGIHIREMSRPGRITPLTAMFNDLTADVYYFNYVTGI